MTTAKQAREKTRKPSDPAGYKKLKKGYKTAKKLT